MSVPSIPEVLPPDLADRLRARFGAWPLIAPWGVTLSELQPGRAELVIAANAIVTNGPLQGIGLRGRLLARLFGHLSFDPVAADVTAADGMRLDDFGVAGTVLHTPGHTAGSIALILDSGDAIVGDTLMGGYAGGAVFPTRPNFHSFADDLPAAMESLDKVLAATRGTLFVGHGGPLRHEDVARWRATHGADVRSSPHPPGDPAKLSSGGSCWS